MLISHNALGQEEPVDVNLSPITLNETKASQIERNLERIIEQNDKMIEQNDGSSRNALLSSYIGMMAFLVGLALVIFGLQLSRGEKIPSSSKMYYRILILALILPVVSLYTYALIRVDLGVAKNDYLGVASLLMIPSGAVLILMTSRRLHEKL